MKKEGRDGFKGIEKKKRKKEEAGTCCYVDRTSCEYVRNTFDEFTEWNTGCVATHGYWAVDELETFFFFFENVCLFLEKD